MFQINPAQQPSPFQGDDLLPIHQFSMVATGGLALPNGGVAAATAAIAPYVQSTHGASSTMALTVCTHLGLASKSFASRGQMPDGFYLQGGSRMDKFIRENNYEHAEGSNYVKRNENHQPVVYLSLEQNPSTNFSIFAAGELSEVEKIEKLACTLVRPVDSNDVGPKRSCIELVDFDYRDNAVWHSSEVMRETVLKNEYYPYINGGVEELMKAFLASEENCMVWYGEPGTGKTSAIRGMMSSLDILPVIAMKSQLFTHKNFLREIFAYSDSTLRENLLSAKLGKAFDQTDRPEHLEMGLLSKHILDKWGVGPTSRFESRVPVIVIEDADLLMTARDKGNSFMNQLLNEVDGIGSSTSRKIIFTTNKTSTDEIDPALIRPGRCFGEFHFRHLRPEEAVAARAAAGLPPFETVPTGNISLAASLQKPRPRFTVNENGRSFGFVK